MSIVIVDIDGTVALKGDRVAYHYHLADADLPNRPVIATVEALAAAGHRIVFFSGRENVNFETNEEFAPHGRTGTCLDLTTAWIEKHISIGEFELYMRAEHDHRKDAIVKREMFETYVAGEDILCAIDDRNQVVKMWREELGLTCLQVAYGDF
ncbi:hypothetical protein [Glycomyces sp. NPDC021274]|uniref:phosphatase domain-containing protein n=1 Tax=Glycomyces sp. NPDC021274 TaxID=3155120 RepID=UPI0033D07DB6